MGSVRQSRPTYTVAPRSITSVSTPRTRQVMDRQAYRTQHPVRPETYRSGYGSYRGYGYYDYGSVRYAAPPPAGQQTGPLRANTSTGVPRLAWEEREAAARRDAAPAARAPAAAAAADNVRVGRRVVGERVTTLPAGCRRVYVRGRSYYVYGTTYYVDADDAYEVVAAPEGAVVSALPEGYEVVVIAGETYYLAAGTYYSKVYYAGEVAYLIVPPP